MPRPAKDEPALIKTKRNFDILKVEPLTQNQRRTFESYYSGQNLMLHGCAGTGKTYISLALAITDVLNKVNGFERVIIIRSVVPTRSMGFLPGNVNEKALVFESPYQDICENLFRRGDAYSVLKQKGFIKFLTTSFMRGLTLDNSIILVDEFSNMTFHELDSIITRIGKDCRVIFCGDAEQSDLIYDKERAGMESFISLIRGMRSFDFIDFNLGDIVRSDLVREYLTQKYAKSKTFS